MYRKCCIEEDYEDSFIPAFVSGLSTSHVHSLGHSWGSSVDIATRLRTGRPGFDFRQGKQIFLFSIEFRPLADPTQPLI
jgi:hypothetical protein